MVDRSNKPAHIPNITKKEALLFEPKRPDEQENEEDGHDDISLRSTRSHWSTWFAVRCRSGSIGRAGPTPPRIRTLEHLHNTRTNTQVRRHTRHWHWHSNNNNLTKIKWHNRHTTHTPSCMIKSIQSRKSIICFFSLTCVTCVLRRCCSMHTHNISGVCVLAGTDWYRLS